MKNPLYLIRNILLGRQECPDNLKDEISLYWKQLDLQAYLLGGQTRLITYEKALCQNMMTLLENPGSDFAYTRLLVSLESWEIHKSIIEK